MTRILVGIIITVVSALLIGVTTWNFAATQGAVQKREHSVVHERQDDKIDKVQITADEIKNLIIKLHTGKDTDE